MSENYADFLWAKLQGGSKFGFKPTFIPGAMFDFQKYLLDWNLWKGRSACFADCGLGKTLIELAWAQNIVEKTNNPVLILTALAVANQIKKEGEKFGIECQVSRDGRFDKKIVVTNYQQLHKFNPNDFVDGGVAADESGILKNYDGATKEAVTQFMRKVKYRLLGTATAAPNDYPELGTSSEALGYLGYVDMLGKFFKNDQNSSSIGSGRFCGKSLKFRFKGHAEQPFWRWVCSWSKSVRRPSDLGFEDGQFILPSLTETEHVVESKMKGEGMLFAMPAVTLKEQRSERRNSLQERCEKVAQLATHGESVLVCCQLNPEGDLLEKLISGAVQVSGSDEDESKEEKITAFLNGQARALVSKDKIVSFGLNMQHCHRLVRFADHSWESYYQFVRRCWRFGQKNPVTVDIVISEGQKRVLDNLRRKAEQADRMFDMLVKEMNNAEGFKMEYKPITVEKPKWMKPKKTKTTKKEK